MKTIKHFVMLIAIPLVMSAQEMAAKGAIVTHDGYTVVKSLENDVRNFPYKDRLEPLLGYVNNQSKGMMGLSKSLNQKLNRGQDVDISIDFALQIQVENVLDRYKKSLDAQEVLAMVMQSDTGQMRVMASSNRYNPNLIRKEDIVSLVPKYVRYPYEPGSLLKPMTLAIALEKKRVTPDTLFDLNDGNLNIGHGSILTDAEIHQALSATDIIVKDSNIGITQISWLLTAEDFRKGLDSFGLMEMTGIELPSEKRGYLNSIEKLKDMTIHTSTALGYGLVATPLQLLKAYNIFNNNGRLINPTILSNEISTQRQVISAETAKQMHKILLQKLHNDGNKTVQYDSLEIGGQTAKAYIFSDGQYRDEFHSSFYGFVNDTQGHKYTIGIVVIRANENNGKMGHSCTVPVVKELIDTMLKCEVFCKK